MPISPENIKKIQRFLSDARLANLRHPGIPEQEAIALHQETLKIGAMLMSLIGTVEISLRNTAVENLNAHFGQGNWLTPTPEVQGLEWKWGEAEKIRKARRYAAKENFRKLTREEQAAMNQVERESLYSDEDVISSLTLFFWKRLYATEYEQILWEPTLKRTFPEKRPGRRLSRHDLARNLEQIYDSRNRIAHHEPVLHKRFFDTMQSIETIAHRLGAFDAGPDAPLAALMHDEIVAVRAYGTQFCDRLNRYRNG